MAITQNQATAAEQLGAFVAEMTYDSMPEHVIHAGRRVLLDTIGAGIAGAISEEGKRVLDGVIDIDRTPDAAIWGTNARLSSPGAALVNGTLAHALEMDDFGGCSHSGTVVIPAALAAVERVQPVSGKDLLTAIVAGYEVARRALQGVGGYRPHTQLGWHSTGTCGGFGAAMAVARLLGLNAEQTTWAIGLAGTYTGGTWAFIEDGAMSKRLHPGKAAENGVIAAHLASKGFTGPTHIFEAKWGGFLATYGGEDADASRLTDRMGDDWQILYTGFKPYASCRRAHGGIDALFALRAEHDITAEDVERVIVRASEFYAQMVGNATIETMLDAQMSLPYGLAVVLATGQADIQQYTPEQRSAPEIRDVLARVEVVTDPEMPPEQEPAIELHLRDGRILSNRVDREAILGAPGNPLSDDALTEKFRSLAEMTLPAKQVDQLAKTIWNIDSLDDVGELMRLIAVQNK